ncbi:MAG: PQQ-binding-like beta-propeller repeat protein [Eubacteriales bacterium]|nr:PQQ-binding-like beta-propeller repeat protein [Eubacteriales bacterium]
MEKQYFKINLDPEQIQDPTNTAGLRRIPRERDNESTKQASQRSRAGGETASEERLSERAQRRKQQVEQNRIDRELRAERAAKARAVRSGNGMSGSGLLHKKKKTSLRKSKWQGPTVEKNKSAKPHAAENRGPAAQPKREVSPKSRQEAAQEAEVKQTRQRRPAETKQEPRQKHTSRVAERMAVAKQAKKEEMSAARRQNAEKSREIRKQRNAQRREKSRKATAGFVDKIKKINPKTALIVAGIILAIILVVAGGFAIKNAVIKSKEKARQEQILREQEEARIAAEQAAAEAKAAEEAYLKVPDDYVFEPTCTANTDPSKLISTTLLQVDGVEMSPSDYKSDTTYNFGPGSEYTNVEGVITFRGNNFRSDPTYGNAKMEAKTLKQAWSVNTGGLDSWTGSGWTGQPLIVKWPDSVKQHSNMYDSAKNKANLVEVIYACMDGYIYFIDLETGEATRDSMYLGYTFKGAGALDPRGYPIMYLGAGINSSQNGTAHAFIINLLDCSVMYEFGKEDEFSLRGSLSFFDSSALVCAENDTLIYPGESGILYLIHLNSNYDEEAGTVSINPDKTVKWRYDGHRCTSDTYWWGMEDSAVIYSHYLFVADNAGFFMCLDLNTLQLVWVQDVLDDTNDTPVLEFENGHPYLYISTSFHEGWRSSGTAEIPIWKIDAENGEIVWQTSYTCYTIEGVSGGVQSTIALGKNKLKDNIYVTVSMVGSQSDGVCVALNKETGEKVFEHNAAYAWSSPACVYDEEGNGNVLYCASNGKVYLLDGLTGEQLNMLDLGEGTIEASPAVYNDMAVVGTRDCLIFGIQLQ